MPLGVCMLPLTMYNLCVYFSKCKCFNIKQLLKYYFSISFRINKASSSNMKQFLPTCLWVIKKD